MRVRVKVRPRAVLLFHGVGIAAVAVLAVWLNWRASAFRQAEMRRNIEDLRKSVLGLQESVSRVSVASSSMTVSPSSSPVDVVAAPEPSAPRRSFARLLGSGLVRSSTGRVMRYFDVRDSLGSVRRYYVDSSDPQKVRQTLRTIVADLRDSDYMAESVVEDSSDR